MKSRRFFMYGFLIMVIIGIFALFAFWTNSNLDYLVQWIKHDNLSHIPYWISFLISLIGNGITLLFNIAMEVIKICR